MKIFKDIYEWKKFRNSLPGSLGVVMTMGALHDGHYSLVKRSKDENDYTLCTIFVNPTQFDRRDDLDNYPVTLDSDIAGLEKLETDFLLLPNFKQIYPDNYTYKVCESEFSKILCGASRKGHFDGVLTVVMKLLNIAGARRAYFGEKDYQQYHLIRKMAEALFIDTEIIGCDIVREKDNLAMSSRNMKLTENGRKLASFYANAIRCQSKSLDEIKSELENNAIKVDYLEERFGRRFAAVFINGVRLIDNFPLNKD
ncbi:MAG TPA: pantoate--beta-alanine ligase [Lentisphaeria bacterium]|nr:MAG: pantoate--beta-alanine ligase [Lentisphaerae bacterium GWF2_38_69]HBM14744.1 pantoate--beta-alanine ligase [Lentisphaeria bacterium]